MAAYVVAVVSMVCGVALGAHVFLFYQHSIHTGTALIRSEERSAAHARAVGACVSQLPPSVTGAAGGADDSPGPALAAAAPSGGDRDHAAYRLRPPRRARSDSWPRWSTGCGRAS